MTMPFTSGRIAAHLRRHQHRLGIALGIVASLSRRRRRLGIGIALGIVVLGAGVAWDAGRAAPEQPTKPPAFANPHGEIRVACEECHTAAGWTTMRNPVVFDHAKTGFPLDGKHRSRACKDCHASLVFSHVPISCADCHRDVHEGRNGLRCQDCHTPERWVGRADALRQHATTGFPLRGVHGLLECTRCHATPGDASVAKLSSECVSCHADDYAATTSPNHAAAGYPTRCEECHDASRTTWTGSGFDHAMTGFALTGMHRSLACARCHTGGNFTGLTAACVACHRADYDAAAEPNHAAANFSTDCVRCHGTQAWRPATFDHATTGFPLTGAHVRVACTSCHVGGQYTGTPSDCYSCHRSDYEATTNPNHVASGFPTTCTSCHTTNAWEPATFDHAATGFALTGAHGLVACTSCHVGGQYTGTPSDCYACHRSDYDATTNPSHAAANFGTGCATCHTTNAWQPANFDHQQFFRISSGPHVVATCASCHTNPSNYSSFDCLQCHDHNKTEMDAKHIQQPDYRYESNACYSCHRDA